MKFENREWMHSLGHLMEKKHDDWHTIALIAQTVEDPNAFGYMMSKCPQLLKLCLDIVKLNQTEAQKGNFMCDNQMFHLIHQVAYDIIRNYGQIAKTKLW